VSQRASLAAPARGAPLRFARCTPWRVGRLSRSVLAQPAVTAHSDPNDDRQFGLVGGVIGAGHGVWCSEGHGQGANTGSECHCPIKNRL